jgi:RNA polymerase sigma-70 factor (ECF subfamily)
MLRVARLYVADDAVAQEVVQEAWLGVLQGLDRFEGRASLKTWIFRILVNRAKTRAVREGRTIPFSALDRDDAGSAEPTIDADRFDPVRHHWTTPPASWGDVPEERLLAQETRACLDAAIAAMPANQRAVISLRDLSGLTADEVCQILGVSEANQRVLLHRARARARRALEQYFDGDGSGR